MSLIEKFCQDVISQAKFVIMGVPSSDGAKATGLQYSAEYYAKESVNRQRSDKHKAVAFIAQKVLTSPELEAFIANLVEQVANEEFKIGYEKSGLKAEDVAQDSNDEKIAPKPKRTAPSKPAAKKIPVRKTATVAKPAAKPAAKAKATASK